VDGLDEPNARTPRNAELRNEPMNESGGVAVGVTAEGSVSVAAEVEGGAVGEARSGGSPPAPEEEASSEPGGGDEGGDGGGGKGGGEAGGGAVGVGVRARSAAAAADLSAAAEMTEAK